LNYIRLDRQKSVWHLYKNMESLQDGHMLFRVYCGRLIWSFEADAVSGNKKVRGKWCKKCAFAREVIQHHRGNKCVTAG
jgi:hypothetical protein